MSLGVIGTNAGTGETMTGVSDDKHDDVTASSTQQSPSSRSRALARAVTETEAHVAAFGWTAGTRLRPGADR